jgi:TorA maturation chaperone TorD
VDAEVFSLLSHLWLNEPDELTLRDVCALLGVEVNGIRPDELAVAYTDLFLLNVYPYASVFLDLHGEMNGVRSQEILALYQHFDYQPESLAQAGAPDHLGLLLGLLAYIPETERYAVLNEYLMDFTPVLCLSVERQPGVHPFYSLLAARSRQELFKALVEEKLTTTGQHFSLPGVPATWIELPLVEEDEELSLSGLVQNLLTPAFSGVFLSRNRLGQWARQLGVPLAFGERYRLGNSLFEAAGMVERLPELLAWLEQEVDAWDAAYAVWSEEAPDWAVFAAGWRQRTASARRLLEEARSSLRATAI